MGYSVFDYSRMATDGMRMDAYARAIARTVTPGSIVVDLGAGTGIFALLAAKAGAKRVHAIETNPAVWLLEELAAENGVRDRIQVHHASSFDVELPERADVIISDMRGAFPLYEDHLAVLHDARTRHLAPGGVMMPTRDRFFVGLVEAEAVHAELATAWTAFERRGLSASAARTSILNTVTTDDRSIPANALLTEPRSWWAVDYGHELARAVDAVVELPTTRGGTGHALALWFEATVLDGITYSNAPGTMTTYRRLLLPLLEPVDVSAGDRVTVTLRADARGERWAWDTEVNDAHGTRRVRFRQATFLGTPASPAALLRESTSYKPTRSSDGERARIILEKMDGTVSVQQIADALGPRALDAVRDVVRLYGR